MTAPSPASVPPDPVVTNRPEPSRRTALLALLVLTLVGTALRFYRLDAQCLWMDEVATFELARSVQQHGLLRVAQEDHIAPLHVWMTQAAIRVGGETAFSLRLPSALASSLTVPLMFVLGWLLFRSRSLGLIAAGLMAVSPYTIWYAQEARMYSFLLLASIGLVGLSWNVLKGDLRWRTQVALILVGVVGYYTHHYLALIDFAIGCFFVARLGWRDARFRFWLISQVIAFVAFAPWLVLTMSRLDASAGTSKPLILFWIPYTLFTFVGGFSLGPSIDDLRLEGALAAMRQHGFAILGASAATLAVAVVGLRSLFRDDERRAGLWCVIWLAIPMLLAVVATFITNISYNVRYVIGVYPAFVLILAAGLRSAWSEPDRPRGGADTPCRPLDTDPARGASRRSLTACCGAAGLAVVTALALWNGYENPHYAKADVRPLANLLQPDFQRFDLLVFDNDRICPILRYYGAPCPDSAVRLSPDNPTGNIEAAMQAIDRRSLSSGEVIWLIEYRSWESDPQRRLRSHIARIAEEETPRSWPGVTLRTYRTR